MVRARAGWLPVSVLLVAACVSSLLSPPPASAAEVDGRAAQRNTERISGDLLLLCLVPISDYSVVNLRIVMTRRGVRPGVVNKVGLEN